VPKDPSDHPYRKQSVLATTSKGFVAGLQRRTEESGDRLAKIYGPWVFRVALRAVGNESDALDITHTALWNALRSIHNYRSDGEARSFRRWLYSVARTTIQQHYRDNQRQPGSVGGGGFDDVLDQLEQPEERDPELLQATINATHEAFDLLEPHFHPETFKAARLLIVERMSVQEVAEKLEKTPAAIHTSRHRVRKKLNQILEAKDDDATPEAE
jgi:RNA polymerase sigma factor (sigma-70 family)